MTFHEPNPYLIRSAAIRRLRRGDILHFERLECGVNRWWFESPCGDVSHEVVDSIRSSTKLSFRLAGMGDGLFQETSQSWHAVPREKDNR